MSWPSWTSDEWGNGIAAVAVLGGIATFIATSWRDRAARKADAKAARDAEVHLQSREALARVLEAAVLYLEIGDTDWTDHKGRSGAAERATARRDALRNIRRAALLVHELSARESIYQGVEALRLSRYMAVHDEWEPEDQALRARTIAEHIRDIAATYLRNDAAASERDRSEVARLLRIGEEARELLFEQERADLEAAREERLQAKAEEKAAREATHAEWQSQQAAASSSGDRPAE